jgi:hypothetical protein
MGMQGNAKLLRIFISSTDKFKHEPLYQVIVYAAKRYGLSGASVLRGVMGYGSSSRVYSQTYWEISDKVPLVVEIIDETEKIEKFTETILPFFDNINKGCLITVEDAKIILQKQGGKKKT